MQTFEGGDRPRRKLLVAFCFLADGYPGVGYCPKLLGCVKRNSHGLMCLILSFLIHKQATTRGQERGGVN